MTSNTSKDDAAQAPGAPVADAPVEGAQAGDTPKPNAGTRRRRRGKGAASMFAHGEPMVWLTGGALALSLAMIVVLLVYVFWQGAKTFWPGPLYKVQTVEGKTYLGELTREESYSLTKQMYMTLPLKLREELRPRLEKAYPPAIDGSKHYAIAVGSWTEIQTDHPKLAALIKPTLIRDKKLNPAPDFRLIDKAKFDALDLNALGDDAEAAKAVAGQYVIREPALVRDATLPLTANVTALRDLFRTGNFELTNEHFRWVSEFAISERQYPHWGLVLERMANGRFYGDLLGYNVVVPYDPARINLDEIKKKPRVALLVERADGYAHELVRADDLLDTDEIKYVVDEVVGYRWQPVRIEVKDDAATSEPDADTLARQDIIRLQTKPGEAVTFVMPGEAIIGKPNDKAAITYHLGPVTGGAATIDPDGKTIRFMPDENFAGEARFNLFRATETDQAEAWDAYNAKHGEVRDRLAEREALQKFDLGAVSHDDREADIALKAAMRRLLGRDARDAQSAVDLPAVMKQRPAAARAFLEQRVSWLEKKGFRVPAVLVEKLLTAEERKAIVLAPDAPSAPGTPATPESNDPENAAGGATSKLLLGPIQGEDGSSYYLADDLAVPELPDALRQRFANLDGKQADGLPNVERGELKRREKAIKEKISELDAENVKFGLFMATTHGDTKHIELADIVLAYPANQLSFGDKTSIYLERWWEFLADNPREANSEGGVMPAIFGTVVMTVIMSLAVVPFGVLAALYLREYAKSGPIISAIRIAVNNLAGVPSIVFGVFGLTFFCYRVGKYVDGGPRLLGVNPWPAGVWYALLVVLAVLVVGAIYLGIAANASRSKGYRRRHKLLGRLGSLMWIASAVTVVLVLVYTPVFEGFYPVRSDGGRTPIFGTGGILWASLTLALLTLPVVIVATEEALAAVPNSMREGSYACGASKWQTIRRIVLPRAMPGIMTGMILSMARGAGEVAPLMLVGVAKKASELAVDSVFPYVHPERSFMHLGFHIYDVGFQSQNSEAAKPMVFTTTLLLILIVTLLNVAAIMMRNRLRKKFTAGQF